MTLPTLASFTEARGHDGSVRMLHDTGHVEDHDVTRWLRDADPVDLRATARCAGPTLDIGCGPGRLTVALTRRGVPALGVDVCSQAVAMTRARGAAAVRRDVFARLLGEGLWAWAVLADGNLGIGGDPERLLRRTAALVVPGGGAVVEVSPLDVHHRGTVRLQNADGSLGGEFPWAVLGARALCSAAAVSGWSITSDWQDGGRHFVALERS